MFQWKSALPKFHLRLASVVLLFLLAGCDLIDSLLSIPVSCLRDLFGHLLGMAELLFDAEDRIDFLEGRFLRNFRDATWSILVPLLR